jgi:hypothetical protein
MVPRAACPLGGSSWYKSNGHLQTRNQTTAINGGAGPLSAIRKIRRSLRHTARSLHDPCSLAQSTAAGILPAEDYS